MGNIPEYKIEKLKERGYYENLVKVLEINPDFELSIISILQEPAYSKYGPNIIATTQIDQFVLIDLLEKDRDEILISNLLEILNYNSNFKINLNSYSILYPEVFNVLGPELISRLNEVSTNIYYNIIKKVEPDYLISILNENIDYFKNYLDWRDIDDWKMCVDFFGTKIVSQIPFDLISYVAYFCKYELNSYSFIKEYIKDKTDIQKQLVYKLNELAIAKKKSIIGDPRDGVMDPFYTTKANEIKNDIKEFLKNIVHAYLWFIKFNLKINISLYICSGITWIKKRKVLNEEKTSLMSEEEAKEKSKHIFELSGLQEEKIKKVVYTKNMYKQGIYFARVFTNLGIYSLI